MTEMLLVGAACYDWLHDAKPEGTDTHFARDLGIILYLSY